MLIVDWSLNGPFEMGPPKHHRVSPEILENELRDAEFKTSKLEIYDNFYTIKATRPN